MENLLDDLINILSQDDRLVSEGRLMKNKVVELAMNLDPAIIRPLLTTPALKAHFFTEIDGILVFDKIKFQHFVSNKSFLPDSFTAYKNKIGLASGDDYLADSKEVVLAWPYKDCVLEGGQDTEDAKRDEVFWNETLAPVQIDRLLSSKTLVNFKRFDSAGEHIIDRVSVDENLIIKGNNLLALHSLKEVLAGRVKLIYIDPPYNTEKDSFRYNDNFNHSSWLTFMKNRLDVAKGLLAEDGTLIVQADDNEQAYLKVLLDEVMGEDQFQTSFYIQVRYANKTLSEDNDFQKVMEVAHVYSKNKSRFNPNKIKEEYAIDKFKYQIKELAEGEKVVINGKTVEIFKDGQYEVKEVAPNLDGLKETWATGSLIRQGGTAAEFLSKYLISRKSEDGLKVLYKVYGMGEDGLGCRYISGPRKEDAFRGKFYSGIPTKIKSGVASGEHRKDKPIPNLIYNFLHYEADFGNCRAEGNVDIQGGKKPEMLLAYFVDYFTNPNDIVLDFNLGSGTTAAVAHKMNRRYIGIEQLDYGEDDSVQRLKNVIAGDATGISKDMHWEGGGSFVYCELAKANQTFVDLIKQAQTGEQISAIYADMQSMAFLSYRVDLAALEASKQEFQALALAVQKAVLMEMLDKNLLYVPFSEIDDESFGISETDKALNRCFYGLDK